MHACLWLQPCREHASKQRYTYTNICAWYWFLCVKKIGSANLPHRPLCFKKIKTITTTAFSISSTVVLNPYSHSTAFGPQSFAPLILVGSSLIDLFQSDIQMLHNLQIDNGIQKCVNSSWATATFSVRFCNDWLLVLKIRFQVFFLQAKKSTSFSSDRKILILLLSVLFHLQYSGSVFWKFNF